MTYFELKKSYMNIQNIIKNDLVKDESSVWILHNHDHFDYSDGFVSEEYLKKVFLKVKDLSCESNELGKYIKDWPSEYHLSEKRYNLLSGFDFDPSLKVLEIGCGCGAMSRYLGENFNNVVSVEGSLKRARLARYRTKDLNNVSIVCAPFQKLQFSIQFDVIFCIGVYEYASSFVDDPHPYDLVLQFLSNNLCENGTIVLAIENQFGLKYFSGFSEDHLGTKFEGLEGYHSTRKVKTFGKIELENQLKKFFAKVNFFYPYPDYKLPDCIVSEELLSSQLPGELISRYKSRDYNYETRQSLWDESLVILELCKNGMLPFFSNSFLVFASQNNSIACSFNQLAIFYSLSRRDVFKTQTRLYKNSKNQIIVLKEGFTTIQEQTIKYLKRVNTCSYWKNSFSLQMILYQNCQSKHLRMDDIFLPCQLWLSHLFNHAFKRNGIDYLNGTFIDSTWSNAYYESGKCSFIDQEWVWGKSIKLNVVVLRSIFVFLYPIKNFSSFSKAFQMRHTKKLIVLIAQSMGIVLSQNDFKDFISLESEFQSIINNKNKTMIKMVIRWYFWDRNSLLFFKKLYRIINKYSMIIKIILNKSVKRLIHFFLKIIFKKQNKSNGSN